MPEVERNIDEVAGDRTDGDWPPGPVEEMDEVHHDDAVCVGAE